MILRITFFIITFLSGIDLSAGKVEALNKRFLAYYLSGDMSAWKEIVDSLRNARLDAATERVLLFAEYGLIGNFIGAKRESEARDELAHFETRIEQALIRQPQDGELYAFSAAMVAYKIAHNENIRKALALSPDKGYPLVEQANSLYFRPSLFGGNKAESIKIYERAFDFYSRYHRDHWMYYNVGAWLGQVYAGQGHSAKAEQLFRKLLLEAPGFVWVRDDLLPGLKEGSSNGIRFYEE
jgi:tetratricopeptide (TPR) repeat protein